MRFCLRTPKQWGHLIFCLPVIEPKPPPPSPTLLELTSCCLVLMNKAIICHLRTHYMLLAVLYFNVSGGRPVLPVPSPAVISLLSLLYSPQLWGRHDLRETIRFHFQHTPNIYFEPPILKQRENGPTFSTKRCHQALKRMSF
jgi:hypothetical protein